MTSEPREDAPASAPPTPVSALEPSHRWIRLAGTLASAALFVISLVVLYVIIGDLDAEELKASFARASWGQIGAALGFTALSYLMLTGYDVVALRAITTIHVPYRTAALASFTSYAVSFTLGFPLFTAATVRYWIYSSVGLGARAVASLTVVAGITFWLGMGVVLGLVMIIAPKATASFTRLPLSMNMLAGVGLLAAVGMYLLIVKRGTRTLTVQGWTLRLPGLEVTLKQVILGALDVVAGAAVLWVLLPKSAMVPFPTMLAAYVLACFLGIASHVPGGLGTFEATMLFALPGVPKEPLLGALLVYRLCYYLIPFLLALMLLGSREIYLRAGRMKRTLEDPAADDAP